MPGRPTVVLLDSGSRLLLRPAFRRAAAQSFADPQSSSSSSSSHRRERLTPNFFTPNETLPQPMQRGGGGGSRGGRERPPPPGPPPPPPPPPYAHAYYEAPRQWVQEETERQDWYRPEMSQRGWGPQRGGYYGGQYSGAGSSSSDSGNGLSRRQDRPKQGREQERDQQQQQHPHSPFNGPGPGPGGRRSYHSLPPRPPSDELYGGSPSAPRHTSPAGGPRHSSPSYHRHASPSYQRRNSPSSSRTKMLPLAIRSDPRPSYMASASEEPSTYPLDSDTPRHPLPLLVLDLNGSLVFRGSGRSNNSAPARRPYLSSFLAYCLGFDDASYATKGKKKGKAGGGVDDDEAAARRRRGQWVERDQETMERYELYGADPERPHGCHFAGPSSSASSSSAAPSAHPSATTHLLIWSSAQPQNVDAMIKSMLHPAQAEQIVRCWGRDTLVPHRFYNQKSPSVKDLEIVWDALGGGVGGRVRGERRVLAEERDREDREALQREQQDDEHKSAPASPWGPHNTLLLDDSPEKARLQPYNHLLVPEFDGKRARVAEEYRAQLAGEHDATGAAGQVGDDEPPEGVDTVLLQAVGVLEHARYQKNVAAWIRSGGLGRFAGVEQPGASSPAAAGSETGPSSSTSAPLPSSRRRHSRWECELEPNLDAAVEKRTEAFWRREGRRALLRNEVAVIL